MDILDLILLLAAAICLALATVNVGHPRINLLAAGILLAVLVPLRDAIQASG